MAPPVIYLVRSWPRLSQTFVVEEILALERRGLALVVFALARSGETTVQPRVAEVRAPVLLLGGPRPPAAPVRAHLRGLLRSPGAYVRALLLCLRRPGLAAGYGEASALRCLDLALQLVEELRNRFPDDARRPAHLHAHFAHDPALVGMLAARLAGLSFSFTGHARDLVQIPPAALAARAAEARAVVTCCRVNANYVEAAVPPAVRPPVLVVHHGVDLRRFRPGPGHPGRQVPLLVSVGRLVEKKGFPDLLRALRVLRDSGRAFRCDVYGDGPDLPRLTALRDALDLRDRVCFRGARDNDAVLAALRDADLFVLSPRTAADGDRDGIPNVLVEAMAVGLPVVSTRAGGVAELVTDGVDGLLADPGDADLLARHVGDLLDDPGRRARLGRAARATVEASYDVDAAARELERVLRPTAPSREPAR